MNRPDFIAKRETVEFLSTWRRSECKRGTARAQRPRNGRSGLHP
jgi:hypothetical protein